MMKRKRSTKKFSRSKRAKPYPKQTVKNLVKKAISRFTETKKAYFNPNVPATSGLRYNISVLPGITQGAQDNQRIGDKIFLKGIYMKCRMTITAATLSALTAKPIGVRLILWRNGQQIDTSVSLLPAWTSVGAGPIMRPFGTNEWTFIDDEKCTIIKDRRIQRNVNLYGVSLAATVPDIQFTHYWKINSQYQYNGDGSRLNKNNNYMITIVPYQIEGTNPALQWSGETIFRIDYKDA